MKYGVIEQMRQDYPVPPMCRLLGVSTSGYHAWRKRPPSSRTQQEPRLEAEILAAHQRTRETFRVERLQKDLVEHGVQVGVHRISDYAESLDCVASKNASSKRQPTRSTTCQWHRTC